MGFVPQFTDVKKPGSVWRLWLRRGLLGLIVLLAVAPFAFMHYVNWTWSAPVPEVEGLKRSATSFDGRVLPVYRRAHPEARYRAVFIHGTPGSASNFNAQIRGGIAEVELVAYERPGFDGKTLKWNQARLRYQVDALCAVLEELEPMPTLLVGHSYGGPIALQAAIERPALVQAALLVGGSVDPDLESIYWIQHVGEIPGVGALLPKSFFSSNRELLRLRRDLIALRWALPDLEVPVTMLHGDSDSLVPVENVVYLRGELRRHGNEALLRETILPGVDHFIPWTHEDALRREIEWLGARIVP